MQQKCLHCREPLAKTQKQFCCNGCKTAYHLIKNMGLTSYYDKRILDSNTRPLIPTQSHLEDLEQFISTNGTTSTIHLMVEGLHCAACIWVIETILARQKGVTKARLNMTTRRLNLQWDNTQTTAKKLIDAVHQLGYTLMPYDPKILEQVDKKEEKKLLICLAVAGFSVSNVMLFSIALWAGAIAEPATRSLMEWLSALIALPAIAYAGQPFFISAANALKHKRMNMDVPISLAVIITASLSLYDTIYTTGETYFESAIMLLFFLLIGRYLDQRAKGKSRNAAEQLLSLQATVATVLNPKGKPEIIPIQKLKKGMLVLVAMGERFPADGVITQGQTQIDASMLTGESLPQSVKKGGQVSAGCVNLGAPITVKITHAGENTNLAKIAKLVEEATSTKNNYTRLADKIASWYAPTVHILAGGTFAGWLLAGYSFHQAIVSATAVLIVTCPCALGLAVPAVQVAIVSRLLKMGVILKSATALERLKDIQSVVFDKTGTLTTGKLKLANKPAKKYLQLASNLSANSNHPVALAITNSLKPEKTLPNTQELPNMGLKATYKKTELRLGSRAFCGVNSKNSIPLGHAQTEVFLCHKTFPKPIQFIFEDPLRPSSATVVSMFKQVNITPYLLSGDNPQTVENIAKKVKIPNWQAQVSPQEKHKFIKCLPVPLMCGDGINDAPSLAVAHVGLTLGSATDIAKTSADIILQNNNLKHAFTTYQLAKLAHKTVKINFAFSFTYNTLAIPLAVTGYITPLWAAVFMSASSLTVVLNALRLNTKKIAEY